MSIPNDEGKTIRQLASEKMIKTISKLDEDGKSIIDKRTEKIRATKIKNGTAKGSKNPAAKRINIYNENNLLMFECYGNFALICKENKLPHKALMNSYKQNTKLYSNVSDSGISKDNIKFRGWYALLV